MKIKHKIKNAKHAGFSLVEILLAIVILALVITPILQTVLSSMSISNRSRNLLGATEVGQMTLEVLNSKAMEGTGGIEEMLTTSGIRMLPAISSYVPTKVTYGSLSFSSHSSFVNAIKTNYANNDGKLCFVSNNESVKRFALHNVEHNGLEYDVVVSMTSTASEPTDKYFTYDVYLEVYEVKDGCHYNKRLISMESAVINKF